MERVGKLDCIIARPPGGVTKAVVVFLHGYGMQPDDIGPFAHSLGLAATFYIPEGPLRADPTGRAWWPIDQERRARAIARGPRDLADACPTGATAARNFLSEMLADVSRRHDATPLFLVGFSQGGMLACDCVLRDLPNVAGLGLLSASRISYPEWKPLCSRLKGLPILVSHGTRDSDLGFCAGEALREMCASAGGRVTWVPFEGGHEMPLVVWRALRKFILEAIK